MSDKKMTDKEILTTLDIDDGEVVRQRETPEGLVVLVDRGIKGTPKYLVPWAAKAEAKVKAKEAEARAKSTEAVAAKATSDKAEAPAVPESPKGAK